MLKLFPYSRRDCANSWFDSLEPKYIVTLNDLAKKFLAKYLPYQEYQTWNEIALFWQGSESLFDVWESVKELSRQCPTMIFLHTIGDFLHWFNVIFKKQVGHILIRASWSCMSLLPWWLWFCCLSFKILVLILCHWVS